MKIDRSKLKKSSSEVPADCKTLIDRLTSTTSKTDFLSQLQKIETWTYGKCELLHWIDVLDVCDDVLETAAASATQNERNEENDTGTKSRWGLACDGGDDRLKELLLWTLHFTTLLIEHSFSRHLYSSMEHLTTLLASSDLDVVLAVLNLLYMFSKRSNFISRLSVDKRSGLLSRLTHLAASWGGKDNGFGLAKCCSDDLINTFPESATTLHFEFYSDILKNSQGAIGSESGISLSSSGVFALPGSGNANINTSKATSGSVSQNTKGQAATTIHLENVDQLNESPATTMDKLLATYNVPEDKHMLLFTYLRLAASFSNYDKRLKCVQARLQSLSVLIYSNQLTENIQSLLYSGLLEELVEVLEMPDSRLMEIKASALKSLTSIIHLDGPRSSTTNFPKLNTIIDVTGASSYHGFLPVLVRNCIASLTSTTPDLKVSAKNSKSTPKPFPQPLATALFSFLYHLASYEAGGEALVSCGMMESLLKVIQWPSTELDHITFVTRAVRVIDLITNLDMQSFQSHSGLSSFIARLELEVEHCRKQQPFQIQAGPQRRDSLAEALEQHRAEEEAQNVNMEIASETVHGAQKENEDEPMDVDSHSVDIQPPTTSTETELSILPHTEQNMTGTLSEGIPSTSGLQIIPDYSAAKNGTTCLPQRAALLKSMLNFLKKAISDPAFSDSIRHVMDGTLPNSLKHIISNAEYYGPSLFLLATDVVTAYVFQEPSLLSSLQDNGLTDVVLHALLVKDVPATREVLGSLPNVFSALCLNTRGLNSFVACKPFERLFKVLLSPDYLPAMRRRRSSDPMGDTASNLGNAMDELMRHQPSLKQAATGAIIKLLEEVCALGNDPKYVCWKAAKQDQSGGNGNQPIQSGGVGVQAGIQVRVRQGTNNVGEGGSSDEEDDPDEDESAPNNPAQELSNVGSTEQVESGIPSNTDGKTSGETVSGKPDKEPVPLVDYIHNVMKFVDAILSNNSTDDHCREFVAQKGLVPLMGILGLPNLPIDFPAHTACQSVAAVAKSVLNLAHEEQVLKQGLLHLDEVLKHLEPLHKPLEPPGGSVLLHELVSAPVLAEATSNPQVTPLLHHMSAAHAYIMMFVHVCRTGQSDIRTISVNNWGSELGLRVIKGLSQLYTSLVWESTVLLALCSEDTLPPGCEFGKADMDKLLPPSASSAIAQGDEAKASANSHENEETLSPSSGTSADSNSSVTMAMENLSTDPTDVISMEITNSSVPSTDAGAVAELSSSKTHTKDKPNPVLHYQIKQIKPLLSGSSRLGRALAELFALLVKLCVGSPLRQRRGQMPPTPAPPSPPARNVAAALTNLLTSGLSWQPPPTSPVPRFRLTFFICSVGFTAPMLFDEKKYPFHLMLMKFMHSGGQKAFFDTFYWAISNGSTISSENSLENTDLPEGTGEFLDSWLMLLEKMVNPKAVLDSPHTMPNKPLRGFKPFDSMKYLIRTHRLAFEALMKLWGRKPLKGYGPRMSESILLILCHILKGEKLIAERIEKDNKEKSDNQAKVNTVGVSRGTVGETSSILPPVIMPPFSIPSGSLSGTATSSLSNDPTAAAMVAAITGAAANIVIPSSTSNSSTEPQILTQSTEPSVSSSLQNLNSSANQDTSITASTGLLNIGEVRASASIVDADRRRDAEPQGNALTENISSVSLEGPAEPDVNQEDLQRLMDMGFPRDRCVEAIRNTSTLDQATDYLLTAHNNPLLNLRSSVGLGGAGPSGAIAPPPSALGGSSVEQDDLMRAIAMSLGENAIMSTESQPPGANDGNNGTSVRKEEIESEDTLPEEEFMPLSKDIIDDFTNKALSGCLSLLDTLPDTVYRVCDLLLAVFNRNGPHFKETVLKHLIQEVHDSVVALLEVCMSDSNQKTYLKDECIPNETNVNSDSSIVNGMYATRAAGRIHLFTLLFEDCKLLCAKIVEESNIINVTVQLLAAIQSNPHKLICETTKSGTQTHAPQKTVQGGNSITPKWMTPMLLFIDLHEKVILGMNRRDALRSLCSHNWKWFDLSSGKWCSYALPNNKTIDDAFWAGEASVRIQNGRRKYSIQFGTMMQTNEETGNRRPVMISLLEPEINSPVEDSVSQKRSESAATLSNTSDAPMIPPLAIDPSIENALSSTNPIEMDSSPSLHNVPLPQVQPRSSAHPPTRNRSEGNFSVVKGLSIEGRSSLLKSCVALISLPVDSDALNAVLRLCLRLTQDFVLASDFASFGGVKMLLKLNQVSGFSGFESLATLLIRHILEDPATLKHTIEKVIRASTVSSNSYTTKELHYLLLRVLAPAACRSPSMFAEVARDILRVDITLLKRGEPEEDHRLLVKSLPMKTSAHTSSSNSHQTMTSSVIRDLLNYLVLPQFDSLPDSQRQNIIEVDPAVIAAAGSSSNDAPQVARHQITESAALRQSNSSSEVNIPTGVSATNTANKETKKKDLDKCKSNMDEDENLKKKPLISKSSICRLLAELVKSYGNCAKQITDHVYEAGSSEMIKEDTSALAFLLDELLICKYDKDSAQHVKTLIAALASCNHYPDAQTALVSEMKTGMARALIWPEGNIKHMRIQALAGLICTMIDSCPTSQSAQQTNMPPYKQQQQNMNNMVKMMLKRGLITDLARVSHSLDLSSPNVATTINAVLKPLETLSRIVNQPTSVLSTSANKPKPRNGPISNNATEEGSTNSREENEAGQGESTSERIDPENESSPNQDVQNDTNNANNGTNTTNSEATRAQGNEDGGGPDAEATENDISTAAESIDANSESQLQTVEEGDAEEFEEMMDHILERDSSDSRDVAAVVRAGTEQVIMAGLAEVIDQQPDSFLQDDVTHHDSQMQTMDESHIEAQQMSQDEDHESESVRSDATTEENDDDEAMDDEESQGGSNEDEDSNVEDEEDEDEDDEDEEVDDDDDDEDDDDDGGGSPFDDENDLQDLVEDAIYRFPLGDHDTDDLNDLMIHYPDVDNAIHSHLGVGDDRGARTAIHLPLWSDVGGSGGATGAGLAAAVSGDGSNVGVLGLPAIGGLGNSHVTPNHPLLMGRQVNPTGQSGSESGAARGVAAGGQRTLQRHRGFRGYINLNSTRQTGNPTAPAVLQNFLGSNPQDLITQGLRRGTPLLVDFGFAILDSLENEIPDLSDGVLGAGGRAALSTIPSALIRWNEESRVIDGDSMHDCVTALKPSILEMVVKVREEELAERKSKKKRSKEEEESKKQHEEEKSVVVTQPINVDDNSQALTLTSSYNVGSTTTERRGSTTIIPDELDDTESMQPPPAHPVAQPIAIHDLSSMSPSGSNPTMTEMLTPTQQQEQALRSAFQSMASTSEGTSTSILNVDTTSLETGSARTTVQYQPTMISVSETNSSNETRILNPILTHGSVSTDSTTMPSVVPPLPFSFQQPPAFAALLGQAETASAGIIIPPPRLPSSQMHGEHRNLSISEVTAANPQLAILAASPPNTVDARETFSATESPEDLDVLMTSEPSSVSTHQSTDIWQNNLSNNEASATNACAVNTVSNLQPRLTQTITTLSGNESVSVRNSVSLLNNIEQNLAQANGADANSGDSTSASNSAPIQGDPIPGPSGIMVPRRTGENDPSDSRNDFSSVLGMNISDLPEGVDPSFLAALPEDMRQEVIEEQRRLQNIRQRAAQNTEAGVSEVNPEFLAALPANIQEEVLAQQRMEQQRQAAVAANPEEPVDPGEFLQTLPAQLRQSVLADMEESQIPSLPAEYAAEAQTLRREIEQRNRAMMHERFFSHVNHSGSALSSILRNTVNRIGSQYVIGGMGGHPHGGRDSWRTNYFSRTGGPGSSGGPGAAGALTSLLASSNSLRFRGRQLLDHEGLSCLLILLFLDDPKINTTRLHRILRNLCYHAPTREWVVKSLLSILEKSNEGKQSQPPAINYSSNQNDSNHQISPQIETPPLKIRKSTTKTSTSNETTSTTGNNVSNSSSASKQEGRNSQPSWLNISMDAALGFRANVFQINKTPGGKKSSSTITGTSGDKATGIAGSITIHSGASAVVCRHTLEVLISLAKSFPAYFLPWKDQQMQGSKVNDNTGGSASGSSKSKWSTQVTNTSTPLKPEKKGSTSNNEISTDFWDTLMRLDIQSTSKKGKSLARSHSNASSFKTSFSDIPPCSEDDTTNLHAFDTSPFGQLLSMLSCPVIRRSSVLTDKLLRLLSLISVGQSLEQKSEAASVSSSAATTAPPPNVTSNATNTGASTIGLELKKESKASTDQNKFCLKRDIISSDQLKLAVEVLTSKSCSEEGLEDVTALLLNLSYGPEPTRDNILKLLLQGAQELGNVVRQNVLDLQAELRQLNIIDLSSKHDEPEAAFPGELKGSKGALTDRFTNDSVVLNAPVKVKGGSELQLPSMNVLTNKTSSQAFFLRVLKVIIQLRDAALLAIKKAKLAKVQQAVASVSATEAISTINRPGGQELRTGSVESSEVQLEQGDVEKDDSSNSEKQNSTETKADAEQKEQKKADASNENAMDVDGSKVKEKSQSEESEIEKLECLESLSDLLSLDNLWETLSSCLKDLAGTPDHHAVLVLQATVEAFFLVHAAPTQPDDKKKTQQKETRQEQLAHIQEQQETIGGNSQPQVDNSTTSASLPDNVSTTEPQGSQFQSLPTPGASSTTNTASVSNTIPNIALTADTENFLEFAETHRTVLNQILRQSTTHLADGPFSVLVDHTRVLDFDIKRRYFRTELERMDEGMRREDLAVHVRRENVFEDSFRELHRRTPEEWKNRFYIVFEGEEGQDAGGLLREWYVIISREIFNPMYALFKVSPGDKVTYTIYEQSQTNPNHLDYFKFVGRVIAKAIYDNKLLECYFSRSFYKHILAKLVKYTDMESEDYEYYKGLEFLIQNRVEDLGYELSFSTEIREFGVTEVVDMIPNGRNIAVTEDNKMDYIRLVCQTKMTGAIRKQLAAFLEGFYNIIPRRLISIFNEQELELLLSGLPTIDIDDLKSNTEYHKYQANSLQIVWFWRALRSFDQTDKAKFLQFVTGSSKVPLQGFSALEGMNGAQKFQIHKDDRSTDRLPSAHTCFNQLDLPAYETYDKLRTYLLKAIQECSEGFGFA